ncbi:MAG: MMPL family transporter [Gammaproteobacteria bacterium]|nr:MMPL family transporter [Gammaproteobacteria bacterium]
MKKNPISLAADHPWVVLSVIIFITLAAVGQLPDLRIEITAEGMMVNDAKEMQKYTSTMQTFGSENVTVVYLEDPDLFDAENLRAIRQAVQDIERIDKVERTVSLFSIRYLRTVDGFVFTDPYLNKIPEDRAAADHIVDAALLNPLIERNLLSEDGRVMAVNIYFDMQEYGRGFDEEVAAAIDRAIAPLKNRLRMVFHLGNPSVRSGISAQLRADQQVILPLALLVLVVTLGLTLRNLYAALLPLLTAGLSVVWILGLMAYLDIPVNVMTSIVPALLIIVGSTEDIHLLSEYQAGIRQGIQKRSAINYMADHMGLAVALTFMTTSLGFLSIAHSRIDLLQQFGILTAAGLLLNFLITISLVPASLQLMNLERVSRSRRDGPLFEVFAKRLYAGIFHRRRWIGGFILLVMAGCAYWATQIQVNNNVMDYFESSSELPKQAKLLHENLSGMQALSLVVSGSEEVFLQLPYLEELRSLQEYVEETGWFDKSFSFADFIGVVHSGIDGQRPGEIYLPDRNEVVREYMSLLDESAARAFISADFSEARIIVRHDITSSNQLNRAVDELKSYAEQWMDPELTLMVTGSSYLNSQAVDYMAAGQAISLLLMLLVIFLLVAFLFMNLKAGLVAVTANLFPIVVLFGVMGYFGFALDTGTAMVGAIALGICVDHTMHFMVRYQRLARKTGSESEALVGVVRRESVPIIATAVSLAMGFATLMFSNFPPVARFGMLSALVMLLALFGTFVVTPLLLRYTRLLTVWDLFSLRLRKEVREKCPLFKGMWSWQVRKLIVMSQVRDVRQDEALLLQGDQSDAMRVILEGRAEVWRTRADGSTSLIATYGVGDVFGVTSLVSGKESFADVVAVDGPVRVLMLRWETLRGIAKVFPRVTSKVYENLSAIIDRLLIDEGEDDGPFRDELTGLYRASYQRELLNYIADRANRTSEPVTLVLFTIDAEAQIGERYGRQALRWALRQIAKTVQAELRRIDIFSRWSRGRFVLILPVSEAAMLSRIFDRLEAALQIADYGEVPEICIQLKWSSLQEGESADCLVARTQAKTVMMEFYLGEAQSRMPVSLSG